MIHGACGLCFTIRFSWSTSRRADDRGRGTTQRRAKGAAREPGAVARAPPAADAASRRQQRLANMPRAATQERLLQPEALASGAGSGTGSGSGSGSGFWRLWLGFFVLGSVNNLPYVIVGSAASNIADHFCDARWIGAVTWANVAFGFLAKVFSTRFCCWAPLTPCGSGAW